MGRIRHQITPTKVEAPPPSTDEAFDAAAHLLFPELTRLAPVGNQELARVDTPEGSWVIRRWPSGTTAGKIQFIHDLLQAGRSAGIDVVPAVATTATGSAILRHEGRFYDAQGWLPGAVRGRDAPDRGPLGEHVNLPATLPASVQNPLIEAIARLHLASAALAQAFGAPSLPIVAMIQAIEGVWERARARLRPEAPRRPVIQRWIRAGERGLRVAAKDLLDHPDVAQSLRVVGHFDLWPAHVLVSRDEAAGPGAPRLTGIVDWADAAVGSPLLDLAQLINHFGGWSADRAEETIATYAMIAKLEPDERRFLPAVATLDLIAETAWLLSVAYGQPDRRDAPSPLLRDGVEALVESLERAVEVAMLGDRPKKPMARRWVYRDQPRTASPKPTGRRTAKTPSRPSPPDGPTKAPNPTRPKRPSPPRE